MPGSEFFQIRMVFFVQGIKISQNEVRYNIRVQESGKPAVHRYDKRFISKSLRGTKAFVISSDRNRNRFIFSGAH